MSSLKVTYDAPTRTLHVPDGPIPTSILPPKTGLEQEIHQTAERQQRVSNLFGSFIMRLIQSLPDFFKNFFSSRVFKLFSMNPSDGNTLEGQTLCIAKKIDDIATRSFRLFSNELHRGNEIIVDGFKISDPTNKGNKTQINADLLILQNYLIKHCELSSYLQISKALVAVSEHSLESACTQYITKALENDSLTPIIHSSPTMIDTKNDEIKRIFTIETAQNLTNGNVERLNTAIKLELSYNYKTDQYSIKNIDATPSFPNTSPGWRESLSQTAFETRIFRNIATQSQYFNVKNRPVDMDSINPDAIAAVMYQTGQNGGAPVREIEQVDVNEALTDGLRAADAVIIDGIPLNVDSREDAQLVLDHLTTQSNLTNIESQQLLYGLTQRLGTKIHDRVQNIYDATPRFERTENSNADENYPTRLDIDTKKHEITRYEYYNKLEETSPNMTRKKTDSKQYYKIVYNYKTNTESIIALDSFPKGQPLESNSLWKEKLKINEEFGTTQNWSESIKHSNYF